MIVTFVDPGSRWTAVVTRDLTRGLDGLRGWSVHDRRELSTEDAVGEIVEEVDRQAAEATGLVGWTGLDLRVGVENTVAPSSHIGGKVRRINPEQIIATAQVVGAMIARFGATVIDPAGFGAPVASRAVLVATYPAELIGPRETTGSGKSPRQHARAAWDGAHALGRAIRHPDLFT